MPAIMKPLLAAIAITTVSGCAFLNEPVQDLRDLTGSAPTSDAPPAPQPLQAPSEVVPPSPIQNLPAAPTIPASVSGSSYLIVAPIESIPDTARNIAVVHFTRKDTDRAVAMCKALTETLTLTDTSELPESALNVALWPVANDNAGANCIEMLTDYEPIDITIEAAKRVNEKSAGPFLLTQHRDSGKRMIYDMSFVSRAALKSAVGEWRSLMGSDPANWPPYRSAR